MKYKITVKQIVPDIGLLADERDTGLPGVHIVEGKDATAALDDLFGDRPRRAFRVTNIVDLGPSTNIEFMAMIMSESRYGVLMQAFIVERMLHTCRTVLENQEVVRRELEHGMVHAESWIGCAREFEESYNKYFNAGKV